MPETIVEKQIAIVLGGTNPHKELIANLKKRGYYTVLIDYYKNPPARETADEHIQESTLDQEKVLEIARRRNASLVISACVDQANVVACYVAEKLSLPRPYSYETAKSIANKVSMKKQMAEHKILTAPFCVARNGQLPAKNELPEFPLIVKPADSNGSKGVKRVNYYRDLKKALKEAYSFSRVGKVIIEKYITGANIDAVCLAQNGRADIVMLRKRFGVIDKDSGGLQYFQSIIPANISVSLKKDIQTIAQKITDVFRLKNTPIQLQVIADKNDKIYVIEFAPRVGGGLSYKTVNMIYGFNILDAAIESYFDRPDKFSLGKNEYLYSENNIYSSPCVFKSLTGLKEMKKDGLIEAGYVYKTLGMEVGGTMASKDRVGSFIVKGKTIDELKGKVKKVVEGIEVYNDKKAPVMKKELFNKLYV